MHRFHLLGRIDLRDDNGVELRGIVAQPKRLALLAYLALQSQRAVARRDTLVALFWPEFDETHARNALSQAVHFLRRHLGDDVLISRNAEELALAPMRLWCDVAAFEEAIESGHAETAVGRYAGELLPGLHVDGVPDLQAWLDEQRARLRRRAAASAHQAAEACAQRQDLRGAVEFARRAVEIANDDERYLRALLDLLDRTGDRAGAIQASDDFASRLASEYGAELAAETHQVLARIRARSTTSVSVIPVAASSTVALAGEKSRPPRGEAPLLRRAVGSAAVVLVLGGIIGVRMLHSPIPAATLAPRRVVVATFQNRTGNPALDPLGAMAADWIARGLAGTGAVDVTGTAAELRSRAGVRIDPAGQPAAILQLGLEARAGLVISGAFYATGDSVLFEADFTDVASRRLLASVGPVSSPTQRPLDAIERLRQRVTGALAPFVDSSLSELARITTQPPSYAAYRELLRGDSLFYEDEASAVEPLLRAAAFDSTYAFPVLRAIGVLANSARGHEADSLIHVLRRRWALLTDYEKAYLRFLEGQAHGNLAVEEEGARRMRAAAPQSEFARYAHAGALENTGDPSGAVDLLRQLDPWSGALRGRVYYYTYYVYALHALGQYQRALDVAREGRRQYPNRLYLIGLEAPALAVVGRGNELIALLDSISGRAPEQRRAPLGVAAAALWEAEAHGQRPLADDIRTWLRAHVGSGAEPQFQQPINQGGRAYALAALHDWRRLAVAAERLSMDEPQRVPALGLLGLAAAQSGDSARAIAVDSVLARVSPDIYGADNIRAARALVAAARGHQVEAVKLLRSMSTRGWSGSLWHRGYLDVYSTEGSLYELMHGYAPFDELLVPRR